MGIEPTLHRLKVDCVTITLLSQVKENKIFSLTKEFFTKKYEDKADEGIRTLTLSLENLCANHKHLTLHLQIKELKLKFKLNYDFYYVLIVTLLLILLSTSR